MTSTDLLSPDIVAAILSEAALTDEAKVQALATAIVFEEGGVPADRLQSLPMPESDPCSWSEIQDAIACRRAFLKGTPAWPAAEDIVADARGRRPTVTRP